MNHKIKSADDLELYFQTNTFVYVSLAVRNELLLGEHQGIVKIGLKLRQVTLESREDSVYFAYIED